MLRHKPLTLALALAGLLTSGAQAAAPAAPAANTTSASAQSTEVAELLGFTAPSSFSRWYLSQFGCSAKDSRSKAQSEGTGGA